MRDFSLSLLLALAVIPSGAPAQQAGRPLQLGTIAGTVTAVATGAALVRATVTVIGTQLSAQADADGRYRLAAVPVGTHRLRARMLGYAPEDTSVLVEEGQESVVNFQLQAQAIELEAVVAVGYGTQTRASVTGSVATVTSEDLVQTPAVTTSGAL